jgi:putative hydroxymethylpyrimidine transport system ATP-binding protein
MTDLATIAPGSVPGLIIEASHLAYDGIPLFQDLTLELRAGQWTGLLGPSGVGKSTLMRIAAGLDAGKGTYQATLSNGAPLKNSIALMAQRDALLPWLSVLDNACLGARLREEPITERKDQAAALLTQVGLADYLDAAPVTLSGGMRQRVALIRTLMEDRPIVLLDEPFAALDALNRHKMQDLSSKMLEGRTVLAITHDPLEALRLCHRIVIAEGKPARLRDELVPSALTPRAPNEPEVAARHGELLKYLLQAG